MAELLRITDYFVIVSCRNRRHVQTVAQEISKELKLRGLRDKRIEGMQEGRWALLDYTDVVVHILEEEARRYYGLEHLWADAPVVEWDPDESLGAAG
jgi:ribosome-associated protein